MAWLQGKVLTFGQKWGIPTKKLIYHIYIYGSHSAPKNAALCYLSVFNYVFVLYFICNVSIFFL